MAGQAGALAIEDAATPAELSVLIQQASIPIQILTLPCEGDCARVEAVASGGQPPYVFEWSDGVTSASRQLCAAEDTQFTVRVADAGSAGSAADRQRQQALASVVAHILGCQDSGPPPACVTGPSDAALPDEIVADIFGEPTYFADGTSLPSGRYRVSYVDGCLRYDPLIYGWAVNGFLTFKHVIVGPDSQVLRDAPGGASTAGFAGFDECVASGLASAPVELEHSGGALGIWNNDFMPADNTPGPDGRNPRFRLERLCD